MTRRNGLKLFPFARKSAASAVVQFLGRHLPGKIIPDFRGDETRRLRLRHDHGDEIVAVKIAGAAENGFVAVVVNDVDGKCIAPAGSSDQPVRARAASVTSFSV